METSLEDGLARRQEPLTHVQASRRAQGLPDVVTDPAVIARVVALVGGQPKALRRAS